MSTSTIFFSQMQHSRVVLYQERKLLLQYSLSRQQKVFNFVKCCLVSLKVRHRFLNSIVRPLAKQMTSLHSLPPDCKVAMILQATLLKTLLECSEVHLRVAPSTQHTYIGSCRMSHGICMSSLSLICDISQEESLLELDCWWRFALQ